MSLDFVGVRNGYSAKITIDVRKRRGVGQDRKRITVKTGHNLFQKSNENTDYEERTRFGPNVRNRGRVNLLPQAHSPLAARAGALFLRPSRSLGLAELCRARHLRLEDLHGVDGRVDDAHHVALDEERHLVPALDAERGADVLREVT